MAEKALPVQGTRALIKSWGDANAEMIRAGKKKAQANKKTAKKRK